MARKSKRMALYEAIRQGQVNIAKGLESGQMRSDRSPHKSVHKKGKKRVLDESALLDDHEKVPGISALSKILAVVFGFAVLVILLFGVWFIVDVVRRPEPVTANPAPSEEPVIESEPTAKQAEPAKKSDTGFLGFGAKKEPQEPAARQKPAETSPQGSNVIVIQGISPDQQDKLLPVQEYFNTNGVATGLIQRGGYTLLVTKAGFDYDPSRQQGTDGYRLMQRIKQLGMAYPEATGDTKFGLRPFQDAYALKKE